MSRFLVSVLLAIASASAQRLYTLNIVNANVNPDGSFERSAVTVGGNFGDLITANRNDELRITVNNQLTDSRMSQGTCIVSKESTVSPYLHLSTFGSEALARNPPIAARRNGWSYCPITSIIFWADNHDTFRCRLRHSMPHFPRS